MKRLLCVITMATSMLVLAPLAQATVITYYADLSGPTSLGTGSVTVTIDSGAHSMQVGRAFPA